MTQPNKASKLRGGDKRATVRRLSGLLSPRFFKALSDPSRLALLIRLAEAGEPRTVGEVARGTNLDLSVVSRHLAVLREAGVIRCTKRGKEVWCSIRAGALSRILRDLADAIDGCCPSDASERPAQRSTKET